MIGHLPTCPANCEHDPLHCYHCGWIGHHRKWCPDSGTPTADMGMVGAYAYRRFTREYRTA